MRPKICTYIDVVKYYQDYFSYRKKKDNKFSYEVWSSELDFKSRTFMKLIASGKRKTTNKLIEVFATQNQFTQNEKKHLIHLSLCQRAKTDLQKKMHFEAVLQTLDTTANVTLIQNYTEFISSPELPLLQLMLAFEGIENTEEKLALVLNTTTKKIKANLKKLENIGVAFQDQGQWKSTYSSVKVPDELKSKALKKYHDNTLQEAQAIIQQDQLQRRFRSIMFAMNDQNFVELTDEVEAFLAKLKNKYASLHSKDDRVYKLNLQTYPVTNPMV